jgi:hypothetical protein
VPLFATDYPPPTERKPVFTSLQRYTVEARHRANLNPTGIRGTVAHFGVLALEKTLNAVRGN